VAVRRRRGPGSLSPVTSRRPNARPPGLVGRPSHSEPGDAETSSSSISRGCKRLHLETTSTILGLFTEAEQAQDVFDVQLGEG
jgi:hypothetical protein